MNKQIAWLTSHVKYSGDECLGWPFGFSSNGYPRYYLKGKAVYAHRTMCSIAHGEPPTPKHQAAHSCGKGHEGCVNPRHLRWATHKQNHQDRIKHGTSNRGEQHGMSKLTEQDVRNIRNLYCIFGKSYKQIAQIYETSRSNVSCIITKRSWTWLDA